MKTTLEEWREFSVMFENLMFEGDISQEEGQKIRRGNHSSMVLWVAEKRVEGRQEKTSLEVTFPIELVARKVHSQLV